MRKSEYAQKINRLIRLKIQEIIDGCLFCQGKKKDRDGVRGCMEHAALFNDMVLHPQKYQEELLRPGEPGKE